MIDFINPLALFGLCAAAIPFIIHFLSRFRAQRRDFSSLVLLREIQSRNVRKLRTQQWLLLILRTLIIALLILVTARPVVKGLFSSGPREHLPTAAVFILDKSASSGFVDKRGSAISFLAWRVRQILDWMNPDDRYRIIAVSDRFQGLEDSWRSPGNPGDQAASRLDKLEPDYRKTNLGPALAAAARLLAANTEAVRGEAYVLTDCQRGFLGPDSLDLQPGSGIRWYLVEAHPERPENLAVISLGLPGELVRPGSPLKVTVKVAHYGGREEAQIFPRLYLDNRLVGQGEATIPPDAQEKVVIELPPVEPGLHELKAVIDADGLAADNSRSILLKVPPRARIVLIEPQKAAPDYLGTALETLASAPEPAITLNRRADLPLSGQDLNKVDLFILHGLSFPERQLRVFFGSATGSRNLRLLILPGRENAEEAESLRRFNAVVSSLRLPLVLGGAVNLGQGGFETPAAPQGAASAGAVFGGIFAAIPGLEKIRVFHYRRLPPAGSGPAARGGGEAAQESWDLKTSGGAALLRLIRGENLCAAITTADIAHPEECDLPHTPLFVPVLHSLVTLLVDNGPLIKADINVGEEILINFVSKVSTAKMVIHGPLEQRFMLPPGDYNRIVFAETEIPGMYRLFDSGRLVGAFCVGMDPDESNTALEDREEILRKFGSNRLEIVPAGADPVNYVLLSREGVEIWPWLLLSVIALLAVEQAAANRKEE